ncbi:AMP-binding enzyme family protein [Trichomonas vaginalis G3]|uniref:AMP-binding enzyme family protein n=1 Tax=Trichomonas vaginalis (strain ATCC PRA-98 / G3) TaxID=412133 RepID=A2EE22_TRIV3|nr:long chain fatty acid--CoA ligase family [Trichomonas vaginalis G3]EAY09134.1 AMP-binding enzyme family protein [Trichomonas vaginalis G3]KAI5502633.1 long chain fatty acid--CoA ligase family [Trichomonas vaginalis G3]|eukprot:XP_001321357.1 AMP-binding enzyme family protein [Trichomonas vaginalis G3]
MGNDYSCVLEDADHLPNETGIFRSPLLGKYSSERFFDRFIDAPQIGTLFDLLEYTKKIAPDLPFYGSRVFNNGVWENSFKFMNRIEFCEKRDAIGSCLITKIPEFGANIGILSHNRIEWVLIQHACYAYGYIPVPIYDTFGTDNMLHIINFSHLTHVFIVSTKVKLLLDSLTDDCCLTDLIVFDTEEDKFDFARYQNHRIHFHRFSDFLGFKQRFSYRLPTPETPAFIMFTSGTSGVSKGCIVTHSNLIATSNAIIMFCIDFKPSDSMLSYLPLAHIFESCMHVVAIKVLGSIGFYSGDLKRLTDEFKILKPTIAIGVPRVFERIHDGVLAQINKKSPAVRAIFNAAFSVKSVLLNTLRIKHVPGLDLIFNPIRQAAGGRLRLFVGGGSYIPPELQHFMRIAFNCDFLIGYGLTETTGPIIGQSSYDCFCGNCGVPFACGEAKLIDVEETGYYAKNNEGELLVRGPGVIKNYYKNEDEQKNNFEEGWFKTGDIFKLNKTGQFQMIGRRKEIIKLSQGEYISIQKLMNIYSQVPGIAQIYIHAEMTSRFPTAIVVLQPNFSADENYILSQFDQLGKQYKLNGFEIIKGVFISPEEFSPQNGLLTPSMKQCRGRIAEKFANQLAALEGKELRSKC